MYSRRICIISLALAFIIEVIALASYGYLGAMLFDSRILKIVGAIVCIEIMAFIWGNFFSPKADHRLVMPGIFLGTVSTVDAKLYFIV